MGFWKIVIAGVAYIALVYFFLSLFRINRNEHDWNTGEQRPPM
jgi:hypothetical protein